VEPVAWTRRLWWPAALILFVLALGGLLAAGAGAPEDEGNGSPPGDGIWETEGNWTVESGESLVFENLTLMVNGNLTVDFGGKLTLRGTTMVMDCLVDEGYWIRVVTGGELVLTDVDGMGGTTGDRSEVVATFVTLRYTMTVDGGGKLSVLRSRLADLGGTTGLTILSDDVLFDGAVLEAFDTLYVDGAGPSFLSSRITGDLESSLYFQDSDASIEGCTIINCYYALNARGSPAPTVRDTEVANCFYPINLEMADLVMEGGLLEAAPYGRDVRLNTSSTALLTDVDFDADNVELLDDHSTLTVRWTLDLRVTDQAYTPIEGAEVKVTDVGGTSLPEVTTGTNGTVSMVLLDYEQNRTVNDTSNPHTFRVSKGKYHAVVTFNVTATMTREITVMTNLRPIIEVSSPQPGIRVVMGQTIVFDASRTYDPNGDTLTFNWTTSTEDRLIYSGPAAVVEGSLLLGETSVTLTVSDGEGGVNSTTIAVVVLQATSDEDHLERPQFNATLVSVKGGDGEIIMVEAVYPSPHPPELIGVFLEVRPTGEAILASGELTVEYTVALVPFGMDESTLVIAREDGGVWTPVAGSVVDTGLHEVTATITQSGTYAVMGVMPANVPPRLRVREGDVLVPPHDVEVQVGAVVDLMFEVQDELPNFAKLEVASLPGFLSLDSTTKRIFGTAPLTAGSHELSLTVTDIGGLTDLAVISLHVVGTVEPPELWSMIVDPTDGDEDTQFEVRVLYRSPEGLPPEYVQLRFDNESYDMLPEDPSNENYKGGVWYRITFRLEEDRYLLFFDTSDGRTTNSTEVPLGLDVEGVSFAPTPMEWAVIIATIIAIIIVLAIIRMTSERYNKLKQAHLGRDREDRLDYIAPEKGEAGGEAGTSEDGDDEEADEDLGDEADGEDRHLVDDEDLDRLDEDMERIEDELSEIDDEIEHEEEELVQIDGEIDEIIDELDEDRERAG
jgi:hypothetical protein